MSRSKKVFIGIGTIVMTCCLCLVVVMLIPRDEAAEATRVANVQMRLTERAAQPTKTDEHPPTETAVSTTPTNTPLPTRAPAPQATDTAVPAISTNTPLPTRTPTPQPTETAVSATPTSTPIPTITAEPPESSIESGGLGLSQLVWEETHEVTGEDILGNIYDQTYIVMFFDGNIQYIEQQWSTAGAVDADVVEALSSRLIPADSEFIETYSPEGRPEAIVMVYHSESLATVFDEGAWFGAEPGTFIVLYNSYDGAVTRMIITTGNNP